MPDTLLGLMRTPSVCLCVCECELVRAAVGVADS